MRTILFLVLLYSFALISKLLNVEGNTKGLVGYFTCIPIKHHSKIRGEKDLKESIHLSNIFKDKEE